MFIEIFSRPGPKPAGVFRRFGFLAWWLLLVGLLFSGSGRADQPGPNPVYVILWFDTEDYILPPSDDAAKRLADFLTAEGLHATFKVVGEKARTLERRGRNDVIASLRNHDIGYHANTHSQHPTPQNMNQFWTGKQEWKSLLVASDRALKMSPGFSVRHHAAMASPAIPGRRNRLTHSIAGECDSTWTKVLTWDSMASRSGTAVC
jgi:hypothetical protein